MQLEKTGVGSLTLQQIERSYQKHAQQSESRSPNDNEQAKVVHKDDVKTAVSNLNNLLEPLRTNLKFEFHEELNEYYVTVINPLTNEMIKEIPPKKMLDMYAAMIGFMGILIDEKI